MLFAVSAVQADSGLVVFDQAILEPKGDLSVTSELAELDPVYTSPPHWRLYSTSSKMTFSFTGSDEFRYRALGSTINGVSECYIDVYVNDVLYENDKFIDKGLVWYSIPASAFSIGNNNVRIEIDGRSHLWLYQAEAVSSDGGGIVLTLEDPVHDASYTGVGNLRGWAVAPQALDRLEVDIDGDYQFTVPLGGSRPDVAASYPNYPGSGSSGFGMAYNYGNLSAGSHSITVRAVDEHANRVEKTVSITVERFESAFIKDAADVDLSTAACSVSPAGLSLTGLMVEGVSYDLLLDWNQAMQNVVGSQVSKSAN